MSNWMRWGAVGLLGVVVVAVGGCRCAEERAAPPVPERESGAREAEAIDPPVDPHRSPTPDPRPPIPAAPLPQEASLGGASIRIEIPHPARTLDRIAALIGTLRHAAASGLPSVRPAAEEETRSLLEDALRITLFGRLLGVADPAGVDLERPVHIRILPYGAGAPHAVVSFGTVRPIEALREGSLVVRPDPEGRRCSVGLGVEPQDDIEAEAPPAAPDEDVRVVIDLRTALEAILTGLRRLTALASLSEEGPWPPWLERLMLGQLRFAVEAAGIERVEGALVLGGGANADLIRFRMRLRPAPGPPADAWAGMAVGAPPFGLLDSLDADADMWGASRVNPAAAVACLVAMGGPAAAALASVATPNRREPLAGLLDAAREILAAGDGRAAFGARTLPGGETRFTVVLGVARTGMRPALRRGLEALAGLVQAASEEYGLGAGIEWSPAAEDAAEPSVDRLALVIPRAALGSAARLLRPGGGDLRVDLAAAVGPDRAVLTSETDPERLRRALDGKGTGGGPHGAPGADRLGRPEPDVIHVGSLDILSGVRANPAVSCPGASPLPAIPARLELRVEPDGTPVATFTIGAQALAGLPALVSAIGSCSPP